MSEVKVFRKKFYAPKGDPSRIFLPSSVEPQDDVKMPLNGLDSLYRKTWEIIQSDKDLNLPDQLTMVAKHRCEEIMTDALALVEPQMSKFLMICEEDLVTDFQHQSTKLVRLGTNHFDKSASGYSKSVVEGCRQRLDSQIKQSLMQGFNSQLQVIKSSFI
jgi:hypothetical protein